MIYLASLLASIVSIFEFCSAVVTVSANTNPLLLVVAYDGLRYDFVDNLRTPTLWDVAQRGVWAVNGVEPRYRTTTAPNFWSISTGLNEDSSGIVDNVFWDPGFKQFYDYWNLTGNSTLMKQSIDAKWYKGEPIWITNEKAGDNRYSGCMYWAHCDIPFVKNVPRFEKRWETYGNFSTWTHDFDELLQLFIDKEKPINLGMFYVSEPDHSEHHSDIYGSLVFAKVRELDRLTAYILRRVREIGLFKRMNIIFTADHGHVNVENPAGIIDLTAIFKPYLNGIIQSSSSFFSVDAESELFSLYKTLKLFAEQETNGTLQVYWKDEFPEHYHWRHSRTGPLVVEASPGYYYIWNQSLANFSASQSRPRFGSHGYYNDAIEMRPFFVAYGPAFKQVLRIPEPFPNIDLYNLMCSVLELNPALNDGSMNVVETFLKEDVLFDDISVPIVTTFSVVL